MSAVLNLDVALKVLQCGTCGVAHAIPQVMYDAMYREGGFWYCPSGHLRGWEEGAEKTKIKRLETELEAERQRKAAALARANDAQAANKELSKQLKGAKTRLKNVKARVGNGVCPCCNRTFVNLQRHMHNKHPEYVGALE